MKIDKTVQVLFAGWGRGEIDAMRGEERRGEVRRRDRTTHTREDLYSKRFGWVSIQLFELIRREVQ